MIKISASVFVIPVILCGMLVEQKPTFGQAVQSLVPIDPAIEQAFENLTSDENIQAAIKLLAVLEP